jgi:hypothetical protein
MRHDRQMDPQRDELTGVSLDYLARLEQGRATNPSPSELASLARARHGDRVAADRLGGRERNIDLRAAAPRSAELWSTHPVKPRVTSRKALRHPEVGLITLDCDVLIVQDSDLRLIVYAPAIGSPDADALALLATVGSQTFARASGVDG